jgi:hypothetical protein
LHIKLPQNLFHQQAKQARLVNQPPPQSIPVDLTKSGTVCLPDTAAATKWLGPSTS